MVLLGIVPVLMATPPTTSSLSTKATCFPNFAAWMAARWPAGPEPMTMRSYFSISWRELGARNYQPMDRNDGAGGSITPQNCLARGERAALHRYSLRNESLSEFGQAIPQMARRVETQHPLRRTTFSFNATYSRAYRAATCYCLY